MSSSSIFLFRFSSFLSIYSGMFFSVDVMPLSFSVCNSCVTRRRSFSTCV